MFVRTFFRGVLLGGLIILSIASIFGTIVEQNQPPEKYHKIYEDWAFALMDRINLIVEWKYANRTFATATAESRLRT